MRTLGRRPALVGALGAGAALLAGCGGASGSSGAAPAANASLPTGVTETVTLVATDFAYQPAQIKMSGLGELTIKLENRGAVEHDFTIEGVAGPKLLVKPKETGSATYKITKAGRFNISCTVQGHKEAGMKGTFVVG
jgi:uncharacterized cupredoxin-like copper-binding protein